MAIRQTSQGLLMSRHTFSGWPAWLPPSDRLQPAITAMPKMHRCNHPARRHSNPPGTNSDAKWATSNNTAVTSGLKMQFADLQGIAAILHQRFAKQICPRGNGKSTFRWFWRTIVQAFANQRL